MTVSETPDLVIQEREKQTSTWSEGLFLIGANIEKGRG